MTIIIIIIIIIILMLVAVEAAIADITDSGEMWIFTLLL